MPCLAVIPNLPCQRETHRYICKDGIHAKSAPRRLVRRLMPGGVRPGASGADPPDRRIEAVRRTFLTYEIRIRIAVSEIRNLGRFFETLIDAAIHPEGCALCFF